MCCRIHRVVQILISRKPWITALHRRLEKLGLLNLLVLVHLRMLLNLVVPHRLLHHMLLLLNQLLLLGHLGHLDLLWIMSVPVLLLLLTLHWVASLILAVHFFFFLIIQNC